jgi:hypothetical protein
MIFFISANVLFLFIILFYESGRYIRMNALPHNYVLLVQIVKQEATKNDLKYNRQSTQYGRQRMMNFIIMCKWCPRYCGRD